MREQTVTLVIPSTMSDQMFETSLATIEMDLKLLPDTMNAELMIASQKSKHTLPTVTLRWDTITRRLRIDSSESRDLSVVEVDEKEFEDNRFVGPCVLLHEGEHLSSGAILRACKNKIQNSDDFLDLRLRIIIV